MWVTTKAGHVEAAVNLQDARTLLVLKTGEQAEVVVEFKDGAQYILASGSPSGCKAYVALLAARLNAEQEGKDE